MVSFCAIRLEVEDKSPLPDVDFHCGRSLEDLFRDMDITNPVVAAAVLQNRQNPEIHRGSRQMSEIVVETITNFTKESSPRSETGMLSKSNEGRDVKRATESREISPGRSRSRTSSKRSTKDSTPATEASSSSATHLLKDANIISFSSGNPFVEVTRGILHLFKENQTTSLEEGVLRSQMLCMIGVPSKHKTPDLLQFIAPCHEELEMMRIVHDGSPNQFMVLLRFRCQAAADEFYQAFNGLPYNSLEPETCSLVYISKVESCKESECYPLKDHTELPVCSICLERMDESISTVLTILCNHSFHGQCLAQWEDSTCPVCRYMQSPEVVEEQRCSECLSADDLWICLICGYVGCGRYVGGHSHAHFMATEHSYTMELGQSRVWDYVGDNFVHRLMQTDSADGKLVEAEGGLGEGLCCSCRDGSGEKSDKLAFKVDEKIDSLQLEYTYLLTSQLESQRKYFEEKMTRLEENASREVDELMNRAKASMEECSKMCTKVDALSKEKVRVEKRMSELTGKLSKTVLDLQEERQMNESLRQNQKEWQEKVRKCEGQIETIRQEKDSQIGDLKEQLRDLMFYLEAQQTIASSPMRQEMQEGDVVVGEAKKDVKPTGTRAKKRSHR